MHTITLQVKDSFMNEVINFIENAKDNLIIKDTKVEQDPYFYERQKELTKTLEDIENNTMPLYDFETSMDKLISELNN